MSTPVTITKVLNEHRCCVGWASVANIVDGEGDVIEISDLHDAVLEMQKSGNRTAKLNHQGDQVAEIVGSLVLDAATASALQIDTGGREGWIVQIYVPETSESVWQALKAGHLKMLSIGGTAEPETIED